MTPSEHLRLAAALIADKKRWTQGVTARNADGNPCWPGSPNARQWCAVGAITKISPNTDPSIYCFVKVYGDSLQDLNDFVGHAYTIGAMMHVADKLDGLA